VADGICQDCRHPKGAHGKHTSICIVSGCVCLEYVELLGSREMPDTATIDRAIEVNDLQRKMLSKMTADLLAVLNEKAEDSLLPPLVEQDVRPIAEDLISRGWTLGSGAHS
jgi:hypothetical protein